MQYVHYDPYQYVLCSKIKRDFYSGFVFAEKLLEAGYQTNGQSPVREAI